ncbi:hypothetical protein [Microvirga pakistanensis]|uniref:hypothetical protein n=1 Tax=Microvirga pakistanensis TaxID=1682650 RepID=UPI00106BF380|nr:hypothetical protein [Microvirga pakistanensis]
MPDNTSNATIIDFGEVLAIDESVQRSTGAEAFGVTDTGFVPKPFGRLLAEKIALARMLFGSDIDLGSGSMLRKILELTALEDARLWANQAALYDSLFIVSASGDALSRHGRELGLPRPHLEARGRIKLTLGADLPAGQQRLTIPRGARLATPGGHHVALAETVSFRTKNEAIEVQVEAFYPGPSHNLDPNVDMGGTKVEKIDRWNDADPALNELHATETAVGERLITIEHTQKLTGGELQWPDARYRDLLLNAPRSLWTVESVKTAVSLVPGVSQVQVFDGRGGLDINQSIFGNFNFIERVFSAERDLGSPYYFTVLVAPTPSAIWDGPDGLKVAVESVIEDLRPMGIFPVVEVTTEIGIGVAAKLVVRGLPLPTGTRQTINASVAARELRARLRARIRRYIDQLHLGEPVRAAEVIYALMDEPGIVDVRDLQLLRYPASFTSLNFNSPVAATPEVVAGGRNIELQFKEQAVFADVDDPALLEIV